MVKICQTRLLKLNFEIIPKKRIFRFLPKNFRRPCMKLKIFFCQFPNPWTLRVSGMGGYTSKCEKSQNHCTLMYKDLIFAFDNENRNIFLLSQVFHYCFLKKLLL
jgi:hypothetical protein